MQIRRRLRSVRVSALSEVERRQELREARKRGVRDDRFEPPESGAFPLASDPTDGTPDASEALAGPAGVSPTD